MTASLDAGATDQYQFTLTGGDGVAIDAIDISGTIGALRMQLFGVGGVLVDEDDTCEGRIEENELGGGSYVLKVSQCSGANSGVYALTLNGASAQFNGGPNCGSEVAYASAHLAPGAVAAYKATTVAEHLLVDASANTPPATRLEIRVYGPSGEQLADVCDYHPSLDVAVGSGVHAILLENCDGPGAADYVIRISGSQDRTPTPTATASATSTTAFATATPSPTRSAAGTPSFTPTLTFTSTRSRTPALSPTPTRPATGTPSLTQTAASTSTATASPTASVTDTPSLTPTAVSTPTGTVSLTPPLSPTPTQSATATASLTATVTPTSTGTAPPTPACVGDCRGNDDVTVDEIVTLVNIALGEESISACRAGDANQDGQISVDEIMAAVNAALHGCPAKQQ